MKRILIAIFLLTVLILLSGCSTYENIETYMNTKVFNNPKEVNWHIRADFMTSHYPNCTQNDKALILVRQMKEAKENFTIVRKYYKTEVIYIITDGTRIWPCYRDDDLVEKYEKLEIIDEKIEIYPEND